MATPYWTSADKLPTYGPLSHDLHADVVVVGGGCTGLTTAYLLAAAGKTVVVLERDRCAAVDTGHTSAHLTLVTDDRLTTLAKLIGRTHAQAVWDGGLAAIDLIDTIIRTHGIPCDFAWVPAFLYNRPGEKSSTTAQGLNDEAALALDLGFDAEFVSDVPFAGGPGVRYDSQARFHPRKYLAGVAAALVERGGRIFEHSSADEFTREPLSVRANGHTVTCDEIVLATHNPLVGVSGIASATLFQTKLALYTSYVIAGRVAKGQVPDVLLWDTAKPYRYFRVDPQKDHDVVVFGGEDHKTGQRADTATPHETLERVLADLVPGVQITHRWSGQIIETPDGLPFIGRSADHQLVATGFCGNGLTFGTLGGMLISDEILGRRNPWAELFDLDRGAVRRGLWDYLKENADYPYYLIRDRFAGAEGRTLRGVRRGQGQVIELDGKKVAAYRDDSGAATLRSAVCTHLGCLVAWNDADRTWDCPCHGSRFKPNGDVISGPAEKPLEEVRGVKG